MIRLHVNHMDGKESEMAVSELMRSLRFQNFNVTQGCIELFDNENPQRISQLGASLLTIGCALVYDHKTILVQRIAHIVSDLINNHDNLPDVKLSVYLSEKLNLNYN